MVAVARETRIMSMKDALNEALQIAMREDPNVILLGEDIAGGANVDHLINEDAWGGPMGVTKNLVQEFGRNRVLDTPITEAGFIGAAVGAAATGLRPVAELMYVDFFGCCMDQIYDQGAKLRYMFGGKASVPLVLRTQGGGGRGNAAQHSQSLEMWYVHVPGLVVIQPATEGAFCWLHQPMLSCTTIKTSQKSWFPYTSVTHISISLGPISLQVKIIVSSSVSGVKLNSTGPQLSKLPASSSDAATSIIPVCMISTTRASHLTFGSRQSSTTTVMFW